MKRELIFAPKSQSFFKKSSVYAATMFAKTFGLCSELFARSFVKDIDRACGDEYLHRFWIIQFQEAHASLYVSGREYLSENKTYVYMSNHESWMDIPAMFGAVNGSLRMISKKEIMQIPIVGKMMEKTGFIELDRKNRHKAIMQLENAKNRLREGISIWLAPEGTRTRSGSIAPFKKGGFHIACELELPIVPVFIEGAAQVLHADSLKVNTGRDITVHFCEPVSTEGYNREQLDILIEKVREAILNKQKECQIAAEMRG
jgi:1-acyl-sn-glycerol-3-phosphate acyltransferase